MKTESTAPDTAVLLEFMFRLGQAYLACGEQTAKVELILRRAASAYGMRPLTSAPSRGRWSEGADAGHESRGLLFAGLALVGVLVIFGLLML